jgi:hypothetical protein
MEETGRLAGALTAMDEIVAALIKRPSTTQPSSQASRRKGDALGHHPNAASRS